MDLTQVNLESLYKDPSNFLDPNSLAIDKKQTTLGSYTFPVQITIENTQKTIMQRIHLRILREQVSELEHVDGPPRPF